MGKKFILLFILLIPCYSYSQGINVVRGNSANDSTYNLGVITVKSGLFIPTDTARKGLGGIAIKGGSLWYWNGVKWYNLATVAPNLEIPPEFANDSAASYSIPIGGTYRTGSFIKKRIN